MLFFLPALLLFRNFTDAEEILTKALTKAEEHFGLFLLFELVKCDVLCSSCPPKEYG